MRCLCILLLMGVVLGACSVNQQTLESSTTPVKIDATTTLEPTSTTTTVPEVEADVVVEETTTTTTIFVDYADPVRMFSAALEEEDVVVSDKSKSEGSLDPIQGEVLWFHSDDLVGPCENGLVLMAAHLNKGEPHFNLVDDSSNDKRHGASDHGLVVGDTVSFVLTDDTVCTYSVIEPFGTSVADVSVVEGQPAIYFPKDPAVMTPVLYSLLAEVGDRPIVSLWVSYGGEAGKEFKADGRHRKYNAVVFAELTEVK